MTAQIIPFQRPRKRPTTAKQKHSSKRPANALNKADRAELDERIKQFSTYFGRGQRAAEMFIRRQIRERYKVGRYYWINSAQFDEYLEDLNDMTQRAWQFYALTHRLIRWKDRALQELFLDSDLDVHAYVDRVLD